MKKLCKGIEPGDMVMVESLDHTGYSLWYTPEHAEKLAPLFIRHRGAFLKETPELLYVYGNDCSGGDVSNINIIPKSCVKAIYRLKQGKYPIYAVDKFDKYIED